MKNLFLRPLVFLILNLLVVVPLSLGLGIPARLHFSLANAAAPSAAAPDVLTADQAAAIEGAEQLLLLTTPFQVVYLPLTRR